MKKRGATHVTRWGQSNQAQLQTDTVRTTGGHRNRRRTIQKKIIWRCVRRQLLHTLFRPRGKLFSLGMVLLCLEMFVQSRMGIGLVSVEAKCEVRYPKNSEEPPLSLKVLPYGVNYFEEDDRLECIRPGSCYKYSISNCAQVDCINHNACQEALLVDNGEVICSSNNACREAHIVNGHKLICGGSLTDPFCASGLCGDYEFHYDHFCPHATIETDSILTCVGPNACTANSSLPTGDGLTVKVGKEGVIHCANVQNRQPSCSNMVIEIDHGRRACYAAFGRTRQKCAIHCNNIHDCDKKTIQFRVA